MSLLTMKAKNPANSSTKASSKSPREVISGNMGNEQAAGEPLTYCEWVDYVSGQHQRTPL